MRSKNEYDKWTEKSNKKMVFVKITFKMKIDRI